MKYKALFFVAAAVLNWSVCAQPAAPEYPSKPVTVVVGYPAGGPTDLLIRALAPRIASEWKQPVLVDNKPGANEAIAAQMVARARPDGYTLLLSTEVPLTLNPFLISKLQYDPQKDFTPISLLLTSPLTLVVPNSLPANTLKEFIALAKSRSSSNPLSYASAGPGGVLHLPMAMLAKQNDLQLTHVPYRGVAPLLTDVVSGQVDAAWVAVAGAAPFVQDGRLKALVVGAPARVKALPQVPVFSETPIRAVQADFVFTLLGPAGMPPAITEKIAAIVRKFMAEPDFREKYIEPFGYAVKGSTPHELADYLAKDRILQAERVKVSGATMN